MSSSGDGTRERPWVLKTPSGGSEFEMYRDPDADPARSTDNPVRGWYGLKRGLRGRFGNYVPSVMEVLGLAEVEHQPRNNRMRACGLRGS